MKYFYIFFVSLFAASLLLSQSPKLIIHDKNVSKVEYNIDDIESLSFILGDSYSQVTIYRNNDSSNAFHHTNDIEKISFSSDKTQLIVNDNGNEFVYYLANIDRITLEHVEPGTVIICNQKWMTKNLDVGYYRNGDPIRHCVTDEQWKDAAFKKEGAWCYYDNDPANGAIYGRLYNWYAVNDPRGLAPEGWRVPTQDDWKQLELCLGMSHLDVDKIGMRGSDQGSQLAGRADLWYDGPLEMNPAFGTSGFSALPGGARIGHGPFSTIGQWGFWWTSTGYSSTASGSRHVGYIYSNVNSNFNYPSDGCSVRCVRY